MSNGFPPKLDGRVEIVNVDGDWDWVHVPSSLMPSVGFPTTAHPGMCPVVTDLSPAF